MQTYERLRHLLLSEEQTAIEELRLRFIQLQNNLDSPEKNLERITPIVSEALCKAARSNTEAFRHALIDVLGQLADETHSGFYDPLIQKLTPVIYDKLHREVQTNKNAVSDLIYPVVGGMISRYVTQTIKDLLDEINLKIHNGLDARNIRRKIISKIRGIPESQLLLLEAMPCRVKAALLIHKEMGVVIAQKIAEDVRIEDPDMVASMLTALTDFINNWIEKSDDISEVNEINYGRSKIILEASGYAYLAILVEGQTNTALLETSRHVMTDILSSHGDAIRCFDGDLETLPRHIIDPLLIPLFMTQNSPYSETTQVSKLPLLFAGIMLLSVLTWFGLDSFQKERLRMKAVEAIRIDPLLALYRIDTAWEGDRFTISGNLPDHRLKERLDEHTAFLRQTYFVDNRTIVVKPTIPAETAKTLQTLMDISNTEPYNDLTLQFQNGNAILNGTIASKNRLDMLTQAIGNTPYVRNVRSNVILINPEEHRTIYFPNRSAVLNETEAHKLEPLIRAMKRMEQMRLDIVGHANTLGNDTMNTELAKERAVSVRNLLLSADISPGRIQIKWTPTPPVLSYHDAAKSRCVKLYWYNHEDQ